MIGAHAAATRYRAASTGGPPVPPGAITIPLNTSVQTAVNANGANAIFSLPAGTWNAASLSGFAPKAGNQFWGAPGGGTVFSGSAGVIYTAAAVTGVKFYYCTFQNFGAYPGTSSLGIFHGVVDWTFGYCNFIHIGNCALDCHGPNTLVTNCFFSDIGFRAIGGGTGGVSIGTISGNEITGCNKGNASNDFDAAAMKWTGATAGTVIGNYVHDMNCPGIWFDILCSNIIIDGNTVVNITTHGIFYETCTFGTIRNNVVNNCGTLPGETGIFVSSSHHVDCYNNNITSTLNVANNWALLVYNDSTHSQPIPAGYGQNNHCYNNTITLLDGTVKVGLLNAQATNIGDSYFNNNTYRGDPAAVRLGWTGGTYNFANFKSVAGQESTGTFTTGAALTVPGCTHVGCTDSGWFG